MTRQIFSLDPGWRFHPGDISIPLPNTHIAAYMANKAGWARGAAKPTFDDSDWRELDLPHDWSVEGTFDPANHVDAGFLPRGVGWYRRYFTLDELDRGKHLAITFDGVATHCSVFVNGHLLHRNFCGYTSFMIDISDIASFGEDQLNCIAVRVDATHPEGWWYEGAGIYRHVWLTKAAAIHVAPGGVFVNPTRAHGSTWDTRIAVQIDNASDRPAKIEARCTVAANKSGSAVGSATAEIDLAPRSSQTAHLSLAVSDPSLWGTNSPNLYQVHTEIFRDGKVIDADVTTFGYRTIRFDAERGFFLNDKPVKLLGTCNHQDHAGVGVAVPDSIHEFRIRRLKDMGCNAYRSAHNPAAPELLHACDRLGMLVMEETRNFGSAPEQLSQLRSMILRDRNHPSIILWSICNEEAIQGAPVAARIARTMQAEVKRLDPSRPVTAGVSGGILNDDCIATEIEIVGINYQLPVHDQFHARHPSRPLMASETHSTLSTRGAYRTEPEAFAFASYDDDAAPWGESARQTWRFVSTRDFIAGLFAWTGFDYRGEPSPHAWPCVSSHFGMLDTCGFAKDAFYLHKAWFMRDDAPFIHILPHWNWHGREGDAIRVAVYTNCDEAELLVNDRSLGRKRVDPIEMAQWTVPFEAGAVRALGYRAGATAAVNVVETTGEPAGLGLEIHPSFDASTIPADGHFALPVTAFAVDARGRRVPTANNVVALEIEGAAQILGAGNGDPTCHEPDKGRLRSLFNGLAQVIIQTTATPGAICLRATSPGLKGARLQIQSAPSAVARRILPPAPMRYFVTDWRMSPITAGRPDANQAIAEQDMNTWQRIDPAQGAPAARDSAAGFAVIRGSFTPPKSMQSTGGRIIINDVLGLIEIWLNGSRVRHTDDRGRRRLEIVFSPGTERQVLSILIQIDGAPAGLSGPVELRACDD